MSDVICLPKRRARRHAANASTPPPLPPVEDLRAAAHLVRNFAVKLHAAAPYDPAPSRLLTFADCVDREADRFNGEGV